MSRRFSKMAKIDGFEAGKSSKLVFFQKCVKSTISRREESQKLGDQNRVNIGRVPAILLWRSRFLKSDPSGGGARTEGSFRHLKKKQLYPDVPKIRGVVYTPDDDDKV